MRLLRTMLFAPGNNMHRMLKAGTLGTLHRGTGADAVILDLEDSVPPAEKDAARALVAEAVPQVAAAGAQTFVRLNALDTGWTQADVQAAVQPGVVGLVLPKTASPSDVWQLAGWVSLAESARGLPQGSVLLAPQIESALGVLEARRIATADERVVALLFGALDLTREIGATMTAEGLESLYARSHTVIAAAAAGIVAIDAPWIDIADAEGLAQQARRARQLGFAGKLCIHPSQIAPVNAAFTPSAEEVAAAVELLQAFEAAQAQGLGVIRWHGLMVDAANANQARQVLALARAVLSPPPIA